MTRHIAIDIETTGLDVDVDRMISLGMVEIINLHSLGKTYYQTFNVGAASLMMETNIHGIKHEDLLDSPEFKQQVEGILNFIGKDPIVIHNAEFDSSFMNKELGLIQMPPLENELICTLLQSRKYTNAKRASLDHIASIFGLEYNLNRTNHNALEDAKLVAKIFIYLNIERKKMSLKKKISPFMKIDSLSEERLIKVTLSNHERRINELFRFVMKLD